MRKTCTGIIVGVVVAVFLSSLAAAQGNAQGNEARSPWQYYPEDARANVGDGGPAPNRDLTGTWAGESSGAGVARLVPPESPPPLSPLGKQLFDRNRAEGGSGGITIAESNDPHVRYCDPFGFPRHERPDSVDDDHDMPNRTFVLLKFMNTA